MIAEFMDYTIDACVGRILLSDPEIPVSQTLVTHCVDTHGAACQEWHVEKPLPDWEGTLVIIRGHLLTLGDWG